VPFDFLALLASPAFAAIRAGPPPSWLADAMAPGARVKAKAVPVDFGTWDVDEVQLCEVGAPGYVGDYVSAGRVSLVPDMMGWEYSTANTRPISLV
jgi:activating signal cointegrator complex subunit 1